MTTHAHHSKLVTGGFRTTWKTGDSKVRYAGKCWIRTCCASYVWIVFVHNKILPTSGSELAKEVCFVLMDYLTQEEYQVAHVVG